MVSTKRMLPIALAITSEEVRKPSPKKRTPRNRGLFSHASSGEDDFFAWSQVRCHWRSENPVNSGSLKTGYGAVIFSSPPYDTTCIRFVLSSCVLFRVLRDFV